MTNAELIAKIKAEIERRKNNAETLRERNICIDILFFLDTLEPEKPVQNDLEEYASRAGFDYVDDIEVDEPGHRWNDHDVEYAYRDGIIAGAKWQAERLLKSSPLPEDTVLFNKGVEEGRRLERDDMPKWHKVNRGSCFDKHTDFLLSAREGHFYCSSMEVPRDGYILLVNELERLPKEDVE